MIPRRHRCGRFFVALATGLASALALSCAALHAEPPAAGPTPDAEVDLQQREVRGTWVTTTGNSAIANPTNTAETMRRLREIGLNTVYVETWKNGYTQYPSEVLKSVIGVDRRPNLMPQDPSDTPEQLKTPPRDLLEETLIEAHRNGLVYIAWFEYGFMAAHKDTQNHLRKLKPEWMSRDAKGSEVAKNGFVWMNPLHTDTRRFLLDLVLEAVEKYDLDGVQLDDRIVWPYYDMGYDEYTKLVYSVEHEGKQPPADPRDTEWTRWRIEKVNEYSKQFTQELRVKRPGLILSLSPAVYPWCLEYYLLEWPKWAGWTAADSLGRPANWVGNDITPRWDEFIPQNYRFSYDAFEKTWIEQIKAVNELGAGRVADMYPGIRIVGDGADSSWDQLKRSIEFGRTNGAKGHVLWFSRGVLDVYPKELEAFYRPAGETHPRDVAVQHPHFVPGWREPSTALTKAAESSGVPSGAERWSTGAVKVGRYRVIIDDGKRWHYGPEARIVGETPTVAYAVSVPAGAKRVELIRDRRRDMQEK